MFMTLLEQLAMKLYDVYVMEEQRQGDIGHTFLYAQLSKDAQRTYLVLALFILRHVNDDEIIQLMINDPLEGP